MLLKSMPNAVDSDATKGQHVDPTKGIHLQFCEEPYYWSSFFSQGVSFWFHLPYVPLLVLATQGRTLNGKLKFYLLIQIAVQSWTGFGHYLADPRTWNITEISIFLTCFWNLQLVNVTTELPSGFNVTEMVMVYIPFSGMVYSMFGLLTLILVFALVFAFLTVAIRDLNMGGLLSVKKRCLGMLGFMTVVSIIIIEGTFCESLVNWYPFPYHALFDAFMFQVHMNFLWYCACEAQQVAMLKEKEA